MPNHWQLLSVLKSASPLTPSALHYTKFWRYLLQKVPLLNILRRMKKRLILSSIIPSSSSPLGERERVEKLREMKTFLSGENKDFISPIHAWESFSGNVWNKLIVRILSVTMQRWNKPLAPSRKHLGVPAVRRGRGERRTTDNDGGISEAALKGRWQQRSGRIYWHSVSMAFCEHSSHYVARVVRVVSMDESCMAWNNYMQRRTTDWRKTAVLQWHLGNTERC